MNAITKTIIAIILAVTASVAWAACRTHTIIGPDGTVLVCTTCCYGAGNCTTTCV